MRANAPVVYKDKRAGDVVDYVPRFLWANVTRALAATPCDETQRNAWSRVGRRSGLQAWDVGRATRDVRRETQK